MTLSSTTDTAVTSNAAASEELAVALDRLFCAAAIYGSSHPTIESSAAAAVAAMKRLADAGVEPVLRLAEDGELDVAGGRLPATHAATHRLRDRLEHAGLNGIAFSPSVSVADLGALGNLLRRRPRAGAPGAIDGIVALPATIRPLESWFGIPGVGSAATGPFIEELVGHAFEKRPIAPALLKEHGEVARRAFELMRKQVLATDASGTTHAVDASDATYATGPGDATIPIGMSSSATSSTATSPLGSPKSAEPARFGGGREVALRACVGALKTVLESRAEKGIERVTLVDLLRDVREVLKAASGESTACAVVDAVLEASGQFLLEGFTDRSGPKPLKPVPPPLNPVDAAAAAEDVAAALVAAVEPAPFPAVGDFRCVAEYVSVQLHVLAKGSDADLARAIEVRLRAAFDDESGGELGDALAGFVRETIAAGDLARLDRAFAFLSCELRRRDRVRFAGLLAAVLEAAPDAELPKLVERLWPHLANELVLGLPGEALAVERRLFDALLRTPPALLSAGTPRVTPLGCCRAELDGSPRLLFSPMRGEFLLLFLAIANVPEAKSFLALLLRVLRESPPPLPGVEAFVVLRHGDDWVRRYLQAFLRQEGGAGGAAQLDRLAARTLIDALSHQPVEARGEPWVAQAIVALGSLANPEGDALLERIVSERRLLLFPTWPDDCRRKAKAARERRGRGPRARRTG